MKKVLAVGLTYHGDAPKGVQIETLGLCRAETSEKRSAFPLYEYDVVIINPESYSHFLFGKASKFSNADNELGALKRQNNKFDLDNAFDYSDRANEMDAALKKGTTAIWCLTSEERTSFFGYRTHHIAYLNTKVQTFIKKSNLTIKRGRSVNIIDQDNPFPRYMDALAKSGWRECLADPDQGYESIAETPEGYSLAGAIDLGKYSGWIVTSPRTQNAADQLIRDSISMSSKAAAAHYHSIFMSHTGADKPFVRRLKKDLMDRGVTKVWVDEAEIEIGESLISKIEEGMKETQYIGVVLSKSSIKAPWVKKELDVAMNKEISGGKPIVLPLLYERCEIPSFLTGKLYADFTTPEKYEASLEKLLRRLRIK